MAQNIPTYQRQVSGVQTPQRAPVGLGSTAKLRGGDPIAASLQQLGGAVQDVGKLANMIQETKDKSLLADAEVNLKALRGTSEAEYDHMVKFPQEFPDIVGVTKEQYVNGKINEWKPSLEEGWKTNGGSQYALDNALLGVDQDSELNNVRYHKEALIKEGEKAAYRFKNSGDGFQREAVIAMHAGQTEKANALFAQADTFYNQMTPIVGEEMRDEMVSAGRYTAYQALITNSVNDNDVDVAEGMVKDDKYLEPQQVSSLLSQTKSQKKSIAQAEKQAVSKANTQRRANQIELSQLVSANEVTHQQIQTQIELYKNRESDADPRGITENYGKILQAKLNRQISKEIPEKDKDAMAEFKKNITTDNAQWWWSKWRQFESEKELNDYIAEIRKSKSLTTDQKFMMADNALREYEMFANPATGDSVRNAVSKMYEMEAKCITFGVDVQFGSNGNSFLKALGKDPTPEIVEQKANEQYNALKWFYEQAIAEEIGLKRVGSGDEVGGFIVGQIYQDADGNRAKWNGEQFEEVE